MLIILHIGLKFWKVGSRRIYAVMEAEWLGCLGSKGKRKREVISDSDDGIPVTKKVREESEPLKEVKEMQRDLNAILSVSKGMKLPPGLFKQLSDMFMCQICHSTPMKLPVIFACCCRSIVGCEKCVDTWFGGRQGGKTCPLCHAERAYPETCRLNGLDNLLTTIRPLLPTDDDEENEEPADNSNDDFSLLPIRL